MSELGKFVRIKNLKGTWANEAYDFTPWLAGNLDLLSEALGLGQDGLELVDTEVPVGAYSADIVCTDTTQDTPETVLIENQYGRSDHDHFGKIITYASGLTASTIVLVCETLREEHRTALTWLNSITEDSHKFFAVELELWRINDSPIAPRFNVVVNPDNWARMAELAKKSEASGELTELKKLYLKYWGTFREYFITMNGVIDDIPSRPRKPLPQQWTGYSIGKSGVEINLAVNTQAQFLRVELTLHGSRAKERKEKLLQQKQEVEKELGYNLEWDDLQGTQQCVRLHKYGVDPTDVEDWENQHNWLFSRLRDFHKVFHHRVKAFS